MPTLIDNLNLINSYKSDIKSAIENKGVDMTGVSFGGYAEKIGEIETGGGGLTQQDVTEKNWDWDIINNRASFVGSYIFQQNSIIRRVNLPDCKTVYSDAFYMCSNLSQISLPKCEYISFRAFVSCSSLEYVDLPECTVVSESAFMSCRKISYANLPECLTVGYNTFNGCSSLVEISLPKCISIIASAFAYTGISQLYLPECSSIGYNAFYACSSLEVADLPKVLKLNGSTFFGCRNLSSVNLPNCSSISNADFYNCSSLSQLTIGMNTYKVVYYGGNCLYNTPFLSGVGSIYVPACNYDRYVVANGWSSISARIVGVGDPSDYLLSYSNGLVYGRTEYLGSSFYNDLGVSSSSVLSISLTNCTDIWSSNYNPRSPFAQCSYLKSVELDVFSSVFIYMFSGMSRLEYVNIPFCEYIDVWAFANCSSLSSISIPACKYIGDRAFQYCSRLSSISIPACEYICYEAFANCSSLSNIDLPNCSYLSDRVFIGCRSLTDASLPVCEYIGISVFAGTPLREIVLPECSYISTGAFYQCFYLSYVNLSKCSYIGNAFQQCSTLNTIVLAYDGVCSRVDGTFNGTNNIQYIYVPESLVSDYKVAQYWSSMSDKIYPILSDLEFSNGLVYGWATSLNSGYLNELGISAGDVTGVSMSRLTSIASSTFMNHHNLVSVDIPLVGEYPDDMFNGTGFSEFGISVSMLGNMVFANCSGLEKVTIEYDGIVNAGSNLFQNCPNLSQIGVPYSLYNDYLTAPGWSEYGSLIYREEPLLAFDNGLVYGRTMTIDSTFLRTLGITSNQVISVSLPNCVSVGKSTFLECHSLKDVYLPNCEYLSNGAFYGANYMNGLDLPKCSFIGDYAFYWCNYSMSYLKLGYSGVCTLEGGNALYQTPSMRSIYVPASLVDAYKSALYWSNYSTRIVPIPE